MLNAVAGLLTAIPEVALFASLAIGYGLGQVRFGQIQLGGVCGTLIAALAIGQFGVVLDAHVKTVFFALFIFALGFAGGPQFFSNLNAKGMRLGVFCLVEVLVVLGMVLAATYFFQLDQGTAAGLMAGAATESAVVGTASDAISKLALPAAQVAQLQANVVTAYSITYIFGLITIVIATSQIFPLLLRVNLRSEAKKLWAEMGGDDADENAVIAVPHLVGRVYRIDDGAGRSVADINARLGDHAGIVRMRRRGLHVDVAPALLLEAGDELLVVGHRSHLIENAANAGLGEESTDVAGLNTGLHTQDIVVRNEALRGNLLRALALPANVHVAAVRRGDRQLPVLPGMELQLNDILRLYAIAPTHAAAFAKLVPQIGKPLPANRRSNIGVLAFGIALGVLVGGWSVRIGDIPFSAGTGGGALLTGLTLGWFFARRPDLPTINSDALVLLKDIGLTAFIACVGLQAGPQALTLIAHYGVTLPLIGVAIALAPALVSLLIGRFVFGLSAPVLLGAIAGQQCSTPALSAIQNAAGNSTPLLGYTITYAISNIVLPLMGPLIVGLAGLVARH